MLITNLPNEVVASILRNIESLEDLGRAILTCRHFHNTFKIYRDIPGTVLASSWDPDLLPLAVATELVRTLPKPRTGHDVREFVDMLVYNPQNVTQMFKRMDMSSLLSMVQTQGAVFDLAFDMADDAYKQFEFEDYTIAFEQADVGLSPAEATRFCRAMYRTQLYFEAFDDGEAATVREGQMWLLTSFAMFEVEQIACVYDYLERLTIRLTRFTLSKDQFFGKLRYDFLTLGRNPGLEKFINQGVVWLANLFNIEPDEPVSVLRDELRTVSHKRTSPRLHQALSDLRAFYSEAPSGVDYRLKEPRDNFDADSGPPSALDYANVDLMDVDPESASEVLIMSSMNPQDYGLRECAYVLWDMSRMKDQDLFYQIEIASEDSSMHPLDWQIPLLAQWHELCQMDWEQVKALFPAVIEGHTGWEKTLIKKNIVAGEALQQPTSIF